MTASRIAPRFVALVLACMVSGAIPALHAQNLSANDEAPGGTRQIEKGQPLVQIHPTVEAMHKAHTARPTSGSKNLIYRGGTNGIGVETNPKVYLVLWGSQWVNNDPSGEAALLESFFSNVGGSAWLNTVIQYCQGVASGTVFCKGAGTPAGNPPSTLVGGVFSDTTSAAPAHPTQSQLAAEAVKAAQYFGNTSSTNNASVQYVIATSHGNSASGFGTQYCAWHSSTSSTAGNIAYTNLPYITDAGASCGANFNGLGPNAGITIVEGHEMAETITDQFPSTGWLDGSGSEIGDKCAWISSGQGASTNISLAGANYAVQSLWSNAFNNNAGGCVLSY